MSGLVPSAPVTPSLSALPRLRSPVQEESLRSVLNRLVGTWKQANGSDDADFASGGYISSQIEFSRNGVLKVIRAYDEDGLIQTVRELDYFIQSNHSIVLGELIGKESTGQMARPPFANGFGITQSLATFPMVLRFEFAQTRLDLHGKSYVKIR